MASLCMNQLYVKFLAVFNEFINIICFTSDEDLTDVENNADWEFVTLGDQVCHSRNSDCENLNKQVVKSRVDNRY